MMKYKLVSLLVGLLVCLSAGSTAFAGVEFLRLGGGARPMAMGEAYVGLADDISAMYFNPAGLARMEFPEIISMSNYWLADTRQIIAGFAVPTELGVFGIGYSGLGSGDIQGYDQNGAVTSAFNTNSSSVNLSFGKRLDPNWSWGIGLKSVAERLADSNASTYALDAGLQYRVNKNVMVGAALLNYGSGLTFITEQANLPTSYRVGAAVNTNLFNEEIAFTSDIVSYPEGPQLNLGMEYLIGDLLAVRGGSANGGLRAGLGVLANLFSFDYAYRSSEDLGAAHQLSISLIFGAPERAKELTLKSMALGKAYLKEEKYPEAILNFEKALSLDPKNDEAALLLKKSQLEMDNSAFRLVFAEKEEESKRTIEEIMNSGRSFYAKGQYLEALAEFSKILRIDPGHKEALRLQGEVQFKMEANLVRKSKAEARQYLGEAMKFVITGKYKEALKQVEASLSSDPKNKEALALRKKLQIILKIEGQ